MTEETTAILKAIGELSNRVSALEARGGSGGRQTVWELTQVMEAKEKIAESLKNCHCKAVATGVIWTDEEARKKFLELRKEIRAINEQIASL